MSKQNFFLTMETAYSIFKIHLLKEIHKAKIIDHDNYEQKQITKLYEKLNTYFHSYSKDKYVSMFNEMREVAITLRKNNRDLSFAIYKVMENIKNAETDSYHYGLEDFDGGLAKEYYDNIWEVLQTISLSKGVKLSKWIVIDDYCATRVLFNHDPDCVANRYAFIEKTPVIRVGNENNEDKLEQKSWLSGDSGAGGCDGHIPENELYGFHPKSREWCDLILENLGYILEK